jgi:4-amino-4-deoxy-L-arabinose transferase-like glycosyltransferase
MADKGYSATRRLWAVGFLAILTVHLVWHGFNDLPPVWDMAHHQLMGWDTHQALRGGRFLEAFVGISDYYPPLFYLIEALVYLALGPTTWLAFLVNLPALFLLSYFTFRAAWLVSSSKGAAFAGHLALLFPLVAWTSRETLLDPLLSGWLALFLFVALRSDHFRRRGWTLLLGGTMAAGMLTKWAFAVFALPFLALLFLQSPDRRNSLLGLLDSAIVAAPPVLLWYLPNALALYERLQLTAAGAEWERDPGLGSLLGWIYYPRCLTSYYLYLPLTVLLIWGLVTMSRRRPVPPLLKTVALGAALGLLALTLLKAKDPRYVMPLASPLAVILAVAWADRFRAAAGVTLLAFAQFLAVSFAPPGVPERVAFFAIPGDTDFVSMRQEWVLFQTHYFGVTGPPRRENWRYTELLEHFESGERVGFVPDSAFFHPGALALRAAHSGVELQVPRLGMTDGWPGGLDRVDWVIGKTGGQGISYITDFNDEVYSALETLRWPLVNSWDLPDGSRALLWRNPSR